jgi:hypothetical protein
MRVEAEHVTKRLVRYDHAGEKLSAGGFVVELPHHIVDHARHLGEQAAIVTEEGAERLRHGEDELAMGELAQNLVGQMLGKENRALSTAGWTQVDALARKRPRVIMAAVGIRTADTSHAVEIVATVTKPLSDLLDTLKAIPTVGGGVLLIILGAEVGEVVFEYGMQLVAPTANVPVRRHARDRDCRAHMNVYGRKWLRASDSETDIECHITWRLHHAPSRRFAPAMAQVRRVAMCQSTRADKLRRQQ